MSFRYLFIVNPNSGKRNSETIIHIIEKTIGASVDFEIALWKNIEEFRQIEIKLSSGNFTHAIAVGGDGSVNLVAKSILNSTVKLGIIPTGSGNGLARSLGIEMDTEKALQQLLQNKTATIDVGAVNDTYFFCTSGVGFDAHIGKLFANLKTRGLKTYIKLVIKEYLSYKPEEYTLQINGDKIKRIAFFITIANAGQFGNNFYIAPKAKLNDGLFHVVIAKPFSAFLVLGTLIKILLRKAHQSSYFETILCDELTITRFNKGAIHYDGEPDEKGEELKYKIKKKALTVVIGENPPCL